MIRVRSDDIARPPADVVARLLLQCTRDDPTLVKRTRGHARTAQTPAIQPPVTQAALRPPSIVLANADPAAKQYFEDLVSIAVASSERADDLLREAYAANRKATYATWTFASIAAVSVAVGLAAGAAGMIGNHHGNATDSRLTEIAGEVKSLGQQQQQAGQQLAAVRSEIVKRHTDTVTVQEADTQGVIPAETLPATAEPLGQQQQASQHLAAVQSEIADNHTDTTTVDPPPADIQGAIPVETLQATAVQPTATQPFGATPENPVQEATYSAPWPVYHHPRRRIRTVQRRRVEAPHFLVVLQQNLQTLFR